VVTKVTQYIIKTYAVIDGANTVINTVYWNGSPDWTVPEGCTAVAIEEGIKAGIGWTYVDGEFVAPPTPPVPDAPAGQQVAEP